MTPLFYTVPKGSTFIKWNMTANPGPCDAAYICKECDTLWGINGMNEPELLCNVCNGKRPLKKVMDNR